MSLHRFVIGAVSAFSLLLAVIPGARAQETLRAAAVVNDEVVSVLDVKMRLRLTVMSSGLKDTPELRQRVMRRVLRNLIDERLQAQEAKRLDIAVTDKEVDDALGQLARRNKMPLKRFLSYLQQRGVLVEAMRDQVRAQLTWQALVARRLRPSVQITDEEVNEVAEQVRADSGSMLWQISEIVLTSDGQTTDAEVRRNAERLLRQLRTGAKFGALARQFSESATAPRGGDVGWVNAAQLPEEIAAVLAAMKPGTVSGPIRTLDGYHIVLLRKQRQSTAGEVILDLNQVFFPIPKGADAAARNQAMAAAAEARGKLNGCQDIDATARAL
ncbi:MAG: peptidylprolyl isomerase, partial [Kiloniellaceae bacterium]